MKRSRFGRRKSDRWTLGIAIVSVLGLFLTYTQACHSKSDSRPTGPSPNPTPALQPHTQLSAAPAPETPQAPSAVPGQEKGDRDGIYAVVRSDGTINLNNTTDETYRGRSCGFINGDHPQKFVADLEYEVPAHARQDKPAPDVLGALGDRCGETIVIQWDTGNILCDDTNSFQLGPGLIAWNWGEVQLPKCECEPGETVEVKRGEPYRGDQIECPVIVANDRRETCYECYEQLVDVTFSNGCKEWTETITLEDVIREEVECPTCEPEWTPGEPEVEVTYRYGEWTECQLDDPEDTSETGICPGHRSRRVWEITTTTTVYTNQCDERTRTDVDVQEEQIDPETEECNAECPFPGTCFYNLPAVEGSQERCLEQPGFLSWNEQNHLCELEFPGVCARRWNLNPGQSHPDCLKYTECKDTLEE
jgi:hypothetical protein